MSFRLPFKPNKESTNPFLRRAEIVKRLRMVDPCGFFWPDKFDPEHIHRCTKHRTHGVTHGCNCGAALGRRKGEKIRPAPVHDVSCDPDEDCSCTPKENP